MKTYQVELNNGLIIRMAWPALIMWLSARLVRRFKEEL